MKKKTYLLLLLLLTTSIFFLQAQSRNKDKVVDYLPYYQEAHIANRLIEKENYLEAYEIYKNLYNKFQPIDQIVPFDFVNYIIAAENSNSCYSEFKIMKVLIEKLGYPIEWINEHEVLKKVYLKSGIDEDVYKLLRQRYISSLNIGLRKMIQEMTKRDQKYRRSYSGSDRVEKMKSADVINSRAIMTIFEKYGYPSHSLIGNTSVDQNVFIELTTVLTHCDNKFKEEYILPKLLEFIKMGTCPVMVYKTVYDTYLFFKKKSSNIEYSSKIGKNIVDENRYKAGLFIKEEY
ncbi:hypothetical protein KO504_14000 [Winogradskyella psychrotolerans]|uniref:hypothetical protein n=1 Tax=Winogradskyella psychrotolerans TaxID=1344585 RepID=UPI001C06E7FD|nr:hypothetical protein [Winogradskyella psychrotolerans]MBU2922457.1 hypothetical protein [Winogradskyella psychrotolerans]